MPAEAIVPAGSATTDSPVSTTAAAGTAGVQAAEQAFAAAATIVPGHSSAHGTTPPTEAPVGYGLGDGIPGSSSASLSSGASGPTAARLDDRAGSPTFVLLFRSALVDDDLPGAPTFATDVSPD